MIYLSSGVLTTTGTLDPSKNLQIGFKMILIRFAMMSRRVTNKRQRTLGQESAMTTTEDDLLITELLSPDEL